VDADAGRFGVASLLVQLAEKMQVPVAVMNTAKGVIDETLPHYLGIYLGKAGEPHVHETIENSDCLLAIGYRPIEVTTGDFSASLPAGTIHARGHAVDVGDDNYQAVTLKEVLGGVIDAVPQVRNRAPRPIATAVARTGGAHVDPSVKLTQAAYWQAMQGYLREGDVLFVDNGTSYALFGLKFPPKCTFIGSVNWGSIGYSVGALLGTLTAAPERRHILFVGDGSFQVTAQELSTILRHDHKPVIFLINNGGYTIERGYLGKTEIYNDIANWSYADLPKVFRRDTSARSFVVKTNKDLQDALDAPNDTLIFVESIMDRYDALAPVMNSSNKGADLDYGPRGPQRRDNQLRLTA
jgi:indolepyruvate decarboxylase